jgi:hypothetical protein
MYEIERKDQQVIIRRGGHAVYTASLDSWIVYRTGSTKGPEQGAAQIKDLTDQNLLLALVNALEIKESNS